MEILFIILASFIIGGEVEHKLEESSRANVLDTTVQDKP